MFYSSVELIGFPISRSISLDQSRSSKDANLLNVSKMSNHAVHSVNVWVRNIAEQQLWLHAEPPYFTFEFRNH